MLEKLLEEIEEKIRLKRTVWDSLEKPPYNDFEQSLWIAGMRNAKEIICKHMDDGWIPVDERLPEEDGFYLCTLSGDLVGQDEPFTGMCGIESGIWDEEGCVIAWMPPPEPYRPKDELRGDADVQEP